MKTFALLVLLSLAQSAHAAEAKPKYGPKEKPEAVLLSKSHEFMRQHLAPDFWAMIPYYTAQQSGSACSIASVSMVVNAARTGQPQTTEDELATQGNVLKKVGDDEWTEAMGKGGRGRTLDQLGPLTQKALKAYGFDKATVQVIHADGDASKKAIHDALVANEKSDTDFIIANFLQSAYTADAEVGHIAPVAAYDAKNKRVLIFDPDRDWYEPYWVSEETFYKGLATLDKGPGKNRGILWIKTR